MFINPKHAYALTHGLAYQRQNRRYIQKVAESSHRRRWVKSIRRSLLSDQIFYRIAGTKSIIPNKRVTLNLFAFLATKDEQKFYQLCRNTPTTKLSVYIESVKYAEDSSSIAVVTGIVQNKSINSNLYIDSDTADKLGLNDDTSKIAGFIPCIGTKIQFRYDISNTCRSKFKGILESCWLEKREPIKLTAPPQLIKSPSLH